MKQFGQKLIGTFGRLAGRIAHEFQFGYDAVEPAVRRKAINPVTRSEDNELKPLQRRQLISGTRDLQRNFTIAAWAIRKHLDYVSSFKFQPRTGVPEVDDQLIALMDWWQRPTNCDIAKRHSLRRMVRMIEERRTVDGDVIVNLLPSGHMQVIEGDRIKTPTSGLPQEIDKTKVIHGVVIDDFGMARGYVVCDRPVLQTSELRFRALLSAQFARHVAYYTRIDQVRGVAPLAPAVNTYRDIYEGLDYSLAKLKVAQIFGLAIYRQDNDGFAGTENVGTDEAPDYEVDFNRGPIALNLEPGDRAEAFESKTPSAESQKFLNDMIGIALKGLDIPLCFFDEGRANFSSGRQGWILYDQSSVPKREDLREFLDYATLWRIRKFLNDGDLVLPSGFSVGNIAWDWIHKGIPWINPLQETTSQVMRLNAGLTSRQRIKKEEGEEWWTIVQELDEEAKEIASRGLNLKETPITVAVNVGGGDDDDKRGK